MSDKLPVPANDDVLVELGNLAGWKIESIQQIDSNHEAMVEEHLKAFNYAVTQGIHPGQALFALTQALGLLLGMCIKSGLSPEEAGKMVALVVRSSAINAELAKFLVVH